MMKGTESLEIKMVPGMTSVSRLMPNKPHIPALGHICKQIVCDV
jgi:hypothetical protein